MFVCLSVCQSVSCLDLTREQKGLGSPKLAWWKHLFRGEKIKNQGHQTSDVNKDLTFKAKDKDQTLKSKDQDKDQTYKDKDQDKD